MKVLSLMILSCALLSTSFLLSQEAQKKLCACKDCKCTAQAHCGCYSQQGCACGTQCSCGSHKPCSDR